MDYSIIIKNIYHKPEVNTTDDIMVHYFKYNLREDSPFFFESESHSSLSDFLTEAEKDNVFRTNFTIVDNMPTPVPNTSKFEFIESSPLPVGGTNTPQKISLLELFNLLQMEKSSFLFEPYMYKDVTGGHSFEDFTPDSLTGIHVPFRNMIISNKKFNVVFATVVTGKINNSTIQGGEVVRYYPFKMIKGGSLVHSTLKILLPNECTNKYLKELLARNSTFDGRYHELDLTKFPIFQEAPALTANDFYVVRMLIDDYKNKTRTLKFLLDEIRVFQQFNGDVGPSPEWYRGDEVIIDSASDDGHPTMEAWVAGFKTLPKFKTIREGLGEIGDKLFEIIHNAIVNQMDQETSNATFNQLQTVIDDFKNKQWIKPVEHDMLVFLINKIDNPLSLKDKNNSYKDSLSEFSSVLSSLELKFLNMRYNLIKNCPAQNTMANDYLFNELGEVVKATNTFVTVYSNLFQSNMCFKRDYVKDGNSQVTPLPLFTLGSNQTTPTGSNIENIKSVLGNEPISTDYRKRD